MNLAEMPLRVHAAALAALILLSGCQSYAPLPLATHPALAPRLSDLKLGPVPAGWPGGEHAIDPQKPLTVEDIAFLAVENNPDLRGARAARGVAEAQVLQAGLLPNPQLSGQLGWIVGGPGTATAWSAGLSQDLRALVTLSANRRSAAFEARKVDADLLWQEWQVMGKARLLFVDAVEQDRLHQILVAEWGLLADRYGRSSKAVADGNLSRSTAALDLAALSDLDKQLADLDRQAQTRRHDLAALLGLDPDVELALAPDIVVPQLDPAAIHDLLPLLPERRPDLIALRLGYAAQEEKLRGAILAQFPALVLGGLGGSDTTAVQSLGPAITIDLPIFNRNQGNIAIESATRQVLHEEYANRLSSADADIRVLLADQSLLQSQLGAAKARLPEVEAADRQADAAYRAGNLDERGYVDFAVAAATLRQTIISFEQALLEQQVAMATLAGVGMPVASIETAVGEGKP